MNSDDQIHDKHAAAHGLPMRIRIIVAGMFLLIAVTGSSPVIAALMLM
jgi:hypothetical protein